jgi:integrase
MALIGWRWGEVLDLRWVSVTNCPTGQHQDRRIDTTVGRSSLCGDQRPAEQPRCGVRQFIGRHADRRSSEDVVEDRQALRHSFVSLAADLGFNEPTIATLLGHTTHSITSRYMHSADAVLLAAADAVANATINLLNSRCHIMWIATNKRMLSA